MHILIIGGSDAGISAALRARELDVSAEITVVLADAYPNYSICGLPFYLSGETRDWHALAHRTEFPGIDVRRNHVAHAIDPSVRVVEVESDGRRESLRYDRLIIATGAVPIRPSIAGLELSGAFPLHTMEDSFRVQAFVTERGVRTAVVVGAGYIGIEMADALTHRGIGVTLVSRTPSVLPTFDVELGRLLEEELRARGVHVVTGAEVSVIRKAAGQLVMRGNGFEASAELVIVATGVEPSTALARAARVATGVRGALAVDRRMETNVRDVYAAGDCGETWHRVLERNAYLPLGTTAHKQGRVAGENVLGGSRQFAGSVGTQVVKVFDLAAARTGLRDDEARTAGFDPVTVESGVYDHKQYYPRAHELRIRVTGDRATRRLLGAQIVGYWRSEVAKRIDVFAAALFHKMRVEELNDFDLSYTPPTGSPWDAVQMAAQAWETSAGSLTDTRV
ncbi:MAG TPA: FAD-dependent oxidoreductase [Gemmatimonadaceae bacterium]|jgi:NADPH-dependent 2,4-dienoyl-CoA reductase/sulfur reductase-like enzyme|nr:FAD-dependent oxidoreductase [Gemmatimonadaceae bacterium]